MECSLNHFHFACPDVQTGLALSIRIFDVVYALWQQSFGSEKGQIRQIVSMEPAPDFSGFFEATYRFHVIRENQSWLSSSLEDYEEIVLECE